MERKWKRLAVLLIMTLALLWGAHAMAETMYPVSADRIQQVTLPAGIVTIGDPVITDGKVTVRIDDAKTNWTEVLMKSPSREWLDATLKIAAPSGMIKGTRDNFGSGDKETLEAIAQGVAPEWITEYSTEPLENGAMDGSVLFEKILFGQTTFVTPESATGAGTVLCWENAGGQKHYEYVQWQIIHSDSSAREVILPGLSRQMLSAVSSSLPKGVTAETEMGGVTCTVEDFTAFNSLPIVINAPADATEAVVYANNGSTSVEQRLPVNNGTVKLTITPSSHSTFAYDKRIGPAQLDYAFVFVSGEEPEEELHDFGLLTVWLLAREKTPYPYYNKQGVQPVAKERLTILQGKHRLSNQMFYREQYGNAHLSKAGLHFTEKDSGLIRMEVSAPEWAVAYGLSGSGGDFIYQTSPVLDISDEKQAIPSGRSVQVYNQPLFRAIQAGRALVYLQDGITARYGGYVYVISWYDRANADSPRLVEYISITHDEFGEVVYNAVKPNEQQIGKPVTEVTGVCSKDWQLVVRYDPQYGERAIHYDLHMEDERGVTYQLEGETVFYVPYPEGYSYEDKDVTYQMYHYDDAYQTCVAVQLVPTPYGLRFVEDHLSPFVLMWDDPAQQAQLPKTGDDTPLEWLMGMLFLSAAGLVGLMRRKRSV